MFIGGSFAWGLNPCLGVISLQAISGAVLKSKLQLFVFPQIECYRKRGKLTSVWGSIN